MIYLGELWGGHQKLWRLSGDRLETGRYQDTLHIWKPFCWSYVHWYFKLDEKLRKKDKRRERSPLVLCINHQQQIINISYTLGPWMNCLRSPKNSQTISKLEETKQNYNLVIFRCQASQRENSGCLTTFSPEVWDSENDRESKIWTPTLDQETRLLKSGLSTVSWTISGSLHLWYINFKIQVLSWPDFYYQGFFGHL